MAQERAVVIEMLQIAKEDELAVLVECHQPRQEQATEQAAQNPHREEERRARRYPAFSIAGDPAPRYDHVDMGMVCHG